MQFSISNKTSRPTPRVPFEEIKNKVLGKKYELSLVFCGNALSRRLNKTYRAKDKSTNVLSFPISNSSGEIFINLSLLKPFGPKKLFIHGLLHLKGMEHGAKMEQAEEKLSRLFLSSSISNGTTHSGRHRHRQFTSKGGHR